MSIPTLIKVLLVVYFVIGCSCDEQTPEINNQVVQDTIKGDQYPPIYWYMDDAGYMAQNPMYQFESIEIDSILILINEHYSKIGSNPGLVIDDYIDDTIVLKLGNRKKFLETFGINNWQAFIGTVVFMVTENEYINSVIIAADGSEFDNEYTRDDFQILSS